MPLRATVAGRMPLRMEIEVYGECDVYSYLRVYVLEGRFTTARVGPFTPRVASHTMAEM